MQKAKFPEYPQVSRLTADNVNVAQGHIVTKIDNDNFSFSPNDILDKFLTDNCTPGTTTVYVDMDGCYRILQCNRNLCYITGLLDSGGDWYNMSPAIEQAAIAAIAT